MHNCAKTSYPRGFFSDLFRNLVSLACRCCRCRCRTCIYCRRRCCRRWSRRRARCGCRNCRRHWQTIHHTGSTGRMPSTKKGKCQRRAEKHCSCNTCRFRQKIRRTCRTEQTAGCAGTKSCAHIGTLAMLQQHQADNRQCRQHLDNNNNGKQSVHLSISNLGVILALHPTIQIRRYKYILRSGDDCEEVDGFQRCTADQTAIDIGHRQ
jgi:hypothetical protein